MDKVTGIHAVKEALEAARPLEYVLVAKGRQDTRAEEIVQLARRNGIAVRFEERAQLPVAKVTNLARTMEELKEAGFWLVGLDERAEKTYTEVDYTGPTGIVLGGEGGGLHELTRKRCDFVVSLPTTGPVKSLNVSVASGVVLFEALRQRHAKNRK